MATKLERIRAACAARPDDPFGWYSLSMELWKTSPEEAVVAFEKVRADFPDYLATYYQLGKLLTERSEIARARAVLEAGVALARVKRDGHALGELTAALDALG